ncbi:MAG: hypothetical protein H6993_03245 [Pseudomonadales bacterium]|nr:hypothetical protein [Pseudomonadales bacterium]
MLRWEAVNATSCIAEGDWSGKKALKGQFDTGVLRADVEYKLRCANGNTSELATVGINVRSYLVKWAAPKLNVDGSPANGVAGYKVYWNNVPKNFSKSETIRPATNTEWEPDLPSGTWYVAVSAFDSAGNESELSEPLKLTLP